jgi:secernin
MCDTMVVVAPGGPVWFAKNSDREPGESQVVEHLPAAPAEGVSLKATWITIAEVAPRFEVVLSRPTWMWGAEMGVNEHGVAIGNEAVFTKLPVADTGLTGMDLVRIALERSRTADDALDRITGLLARYGQGGRAGLRDKRFRYHNAFLIADRAGAWVLETADRHWAAVRVRSGVRTISNVLTLDGPPDAVSDGCLDDAWRRGYWNGAQPFSFRDAFARKEMTLLSGGDVRRACSAKILLGRDVAVGCDLARVAATLRSHNERDPSEAGWRMESPCAHASPLPTRRAGQTTGSMIASLSTDGPRVWSTGTSSPCLSVFKPLVMGKGALVDTGPIAGSDRADPESLWWRHERLHRAVITREYERARALFEDERAAMEREAWAIDADPRAASEAFARHRAALVEWARRVESASAGDAVGVRARAERWFWARESRRDAL